MRPFLLTSAARKDLIDIGRFSTQQWGIQQRNNYLKQLDDAFHLLASQPTLGKDATDIKAGYRKFNQGSHVIFYREGTESTIIVVRVLHNSMDMDRHF